MILHLEWLHIISAPDKTTILEWVARDKSRHNEEHKKKKKKCYDTPKVTRGTSFGEIDFLVLVLWGVDEE